MHNDNSTASLAILWAINVCVTGSSATPLTTKILSPTPEERVLAAGVDIWMKVTSRSSL